MQNLTRIGLRVRLFLCPAYSPRGFSFVPLFRIGPNDFEYFTFGWHALREIVKGRDCVAQVSHSFFLTDGKY